ncbi:hypothetical protein Q9L58_010171 [Maublancomyces gigas]|uniref:VWFA domain-containing protein n=1 Tax=Discina gigas TaxID=1032678 RepID=A0ABR3G4W7_9PEZI
MVDIRGVGVVETSPLTPPSMIGSRGANVFGTSPLTPPSMVDLQGVGAVGASPPITSSRGVNAVETCPQITGLRGIGVPTSMVGLPGVGIVETSASKIGLRGANAFETLTPPSMAGLRPVGAVGASIPAIGLRDVDAVKTPIISSRGVNAFETFPLTPPSKIGLRGVGIVETSTPVVGLHGANAFETSPLTPPSVIGLPGRGAVGTCPPVIGLQSVNAFETSLTPPSKIGSHGVNVFGTSPITLPSIVDLRGVGIVETSLPAIGPRDVDVVGTPIIGPTGVNAFTPSPPMAGLRGIGVSAPMIGLPGLGAVGTSSPVTVSRGVNAFGTSPLTPPSVIGLPGLSAVGTSPPVAGLRGIGVSAPMIGLPGLGAVGTSPPVVGLHGANTFGTSPLTPSSMIDLRGVGAVETSPPMTSSRGANAFGPSSLTPPSMVGLRGVNAFTPAPLTPPSMTSLRPVGAVETSLPAIGPRDVHVVGTPIIGPTGVNAFTPSPPTPPSMIGVGAVETSTNLRDVGPAKTSASMISLQNADAVEHFNSNSIENPYLISAPKVGENLPARTNLHAPPALLPRPAVSANDGFESGKAMETKPQISPDDADIFPGSTLRFGTAPAAALGEVGSAARDVILATAKWTQGALLRLQGSGQSPEPLDIVGEKAGSRVWVAVGEVLDDALESTSPQDSIVVVGDLDRGCAPAAEHSRGGTGGTSARETTGIQTLQDLGAEVDTITETANSEGPATTTARDREAEEVAYFQGSRGDATEVMLEHAMAGWNTTPQGTTAGRIGSTGEGLRAPTTAVSHAVRHAANGLAPPAIDRKLQLKLADGGLGIANQSISETRQSRSIENNMATVLGDPDIVTVSEGRAGLQVTSEVHREEGEKSSPIVKEHAIRYVGNLLGITGGADNTFSELSLGHDIYGPDRTKQPTSGRIVGQDGHTGSAIPRVPSTFVGSLFNSLEDTRVRGTVQKLAINGAMNDDINAPNATTIGRLSVSPVLEHAVAGLDNQKPLKEIVIPLHVINKDEVTGLDGSHNPMRDPSGAEDTGVAYGGVVSSRLVAMDDGIQLTTSTPNPASVTNPRAWDIGQSPTIGQKTTAGFAGSHNQIVTARGLERMREVLGEEAEPVRPVIYIGGVPGIIETDTVVASPTLEHHIHRSRVVELGGEAGVHQTAWGHTVRLGSPGAILGTEELDDNVSVDGKAESIMQQMARDRAARDGSSVPNLSAVEKRVGEINKVSTGEHNRIRQSAIYHELEVVAGGMEDPNEVSSGVLESKIQKSITNIINPVIHDAHTSNPVAVDIQEASLRLEPAVDKSGVTNQTLSLRPTEYAAIDKNTILDLADFLILMASPGDQREGLGDLGGREGNKLAAIMESNAMHVAATGAARRISASPSSQHVIGGWDVATDADLETFQDSATGTDSMMEIVGPLGLVMAPGDFEFGGMGGMNDGVEELGALKATTIAMYEVTNTPDPPTASEESASPVPGHAVDQLRVVEPTTNFEASQIAHGRSIPQENSISENPHHTTPMLGDLGDMAGWDSHVEVATAQKPAIPGSRDISPIATTNPQITHGHIVAQEGSILGRETPCCTTPIPGGLGDMAGCDSKIPGKNLDIPPRKPAVPGTRDISPIATVSQQITHGHIVAQEGSILGRETPCCTTPIPGGLGDMAGCDSKIPGKNLDIPPRKPAVPGTRDISPIATVSQQITYGHTIPQEGSILGRETPRCTTLTSGDDVHVGDMAEWDSSIEVTTTQKSTTPGNRDIQPPISATNPSATSNGLAGPQTTNDHTITREDSIPGHYTTLGDVGDMAGWDSVEVAAIQKPTTPGNRDIQPPTAVANPFATTKGTTGPQTTNDHTITREDSFPGHYTAPGDVGDMAGWDSVEVAAIQKPTTPGNRDIQPPTAVANPFATTKGTTGPQTTNDHTITREDSFPGHYTAPGDVGDMAGWDSVEVAAIQKPTTPGNRDIQPPTAVTNPFATSKGTTGLQITIAEEDTTITGRETPLPTTFMFGDVGDMAGRDSSGEVATTQESTIPGNSDIQPPIDPFAARNGLTGPQIPDDHTLAQGDAIAGRATPHYTTLTSGDVRNMTEWDSNVEVATARKPIVPGNRNIQLPTTAINPSSTSNGLTGPQIAYDYIITQENEITGRETPHRALLGSGVGDITRYDNTMLENDIKPPVTTANSSANRELASLYLGHDIDESETPEPVTKLETTQNPSTEPATIRHPVLAAISQGSRDRGDIVSESQESAAHNLAAILAQDGIRHNNLTGGIAATGKALSPEHDTDGREATGQPANPKTTRPTEGVPSTSVPRTQSPDVIPTAEALGDMRYVAVQQPTAQKATIIETTSYSASKAASTTCVRSAEILRDREFAPSTRTESIGSPGAVDILDNMVRVLPDEWWPKPQVSDSSIMNNPVYESTDPENDIPKPKTQLSVKTSANHGTCPAITPNHTSTTATTLLFPEQGIGVQDVKEGAMKPEITGTADSDFSPTTHMDPHVITGVTEDPENTVGVHEKRKSTIQNSTAVTSHADNDPPRVAATLDKSAHLPLGHDDDQRQPTYQTATIQTVLIADGSSSTIGMFAYVSLPYDGAKNLKDTVTLYEDIRAKPQRSTKNTIDHNIHGTSTFPPVVDKRDATPNIKQNSDGWKATDPTTDRGGFQMTSDSDVTPSFASQQIIAEDAGDRVDTLNHRQAGARSPSTSDSTTITSPSSDTIKKFDVRPKDAALGTSRNDASVPIEIKHDGLTEQSTRSDVGTTNTIGNLHRGIEPVPDPPRAESNFQNDSQDTHVLPSAMTELGLFPAHGGSPPVVGLTPWQEIVRNVRNNSRKPARRPRRTRRPQPLALGNIIPDSTGVDQRSSEIAVTDANNYSEKSSPSRIPNETTPESTNLINDPTLHQESVSTRPKALSEDLIRHKTPPGELNKRPITTDNAIQELPIIMRPNQSTIPSSPKEGHDISPPTTGELPVPEKLTQSISPNHYFVVELIGDSEAVGIDLVAPPKQPPPIQNKISHDLQTHNQEATTNTAAPMPVLTLEETVQESNTHDQDAAPADDAPAQNQSNSSEDLDHASGVNVSRHLPAHQSTEEATNPLGDTETASDELHTSVGVMLKKVDIGDGGPTLTLERSDLVETDRECSNTHDQDVVPNSDASTQNQPNLSDHGHAPGVPDETTNLLENAETTSDMKQTRAPHPDSPPTEIVSLELQSSLIDVNNTTVKQDVASSGAISASVEKSHLPQTVQEFTNTHDQIAAPTGNAPTQNQPNVSDHSHAPEAHASHQSKEETTNPLENTEITLCLDNGLPTEKISLEPQPTSAELDTIPNVAVQKLASVEKAILGESDQEHPGTRGQDVAPGDDALAQNQSNAFPLDNSPPAENISPKLQPTSAELDTILEKLDAAVHESVEEAILEETVQEHPGARGQDAALIDSGLAQNQSNAPYLDNGPPTEHIPLGLQPTSVELGTILEKLDVAVQKSASVEKATLEESDQEHPGTRGQDVAPGDDVLTQNQPNAFPLDNGSPTENIPLGLQPTSVELGIILEKLDVTVPSVEKVILVKTDQEHPGARGQDTAPAGDTLARNQPNAFPLDNGPPTKNISPKLQPTSDELDTILEKLDAAVQKSASAEKAILEETDQEHPGARGQDAAPTGDTLAQNQSNAFPPDNGPPTKNISLKLQPTSDELDTILEKLDVAATTATIQISTSAENLLTLAGAVQENSNTRGQDAAPTSDASTKNQLKVFEHLSHAPGVHALRQLPAHQSKEETTNPPENTEIAANTHFPENGQPTGNLTPRLQPTPVDLDTILEKLDVVATMATLQASTSVENSTCVETVQEYSNTRGQDAAPTGEAPAQNQSNAPYLDNSPPTEDISLERKPTSVVDVDAILEKLDISDDVPTAIEKLAQVEKSPVAETTQEYSNSQDAALADDSPTQDQSNISKDLSHAPVIHVLPQPQAHQPSTNSSQNTRTAPDTEQTHTPHLDNNQLTEDLTRLQPTPVDLDTILKKLDVAAFTTQPSTSVEKLALVETVQDYLNTRGKDTVPAGEAPAQNQPKVSENPSHVPAVHRLPAQRPQEETSSFENIETTSDIQQTHTLYPDNSQPTEDLSPGLQCAPVDPDAIPGKLDSADGVPTAIETSTLVEKSQPAILHNHESTKSTEIPTNLEVTPSTLLLGPDITHGKHTGVAVENTDADEPTLDDIAPQNPVHLKEISVLAETSPYNHGVSKLDHNIQDSARFEAINVSVPLTEAHNTPGTTVIVGNRAGEVEESTYDKPPVIKNSVSDAYSHLNITPSGQSGITIQSTENPVQNMTTAADYLDTTHPETVPPTLSAAQVPLPDGGADTPIVQSHTQQPSLSPVDGGSAQSLASTPVGFHIQYVPHRSHNFVQYYGLHFLTYIETIENFNKHLISRISSMGLERFYPPDHPRLLELSKMAAALALDKSSELSAPECIVDLASLALFDKILYLDDSRSMQIGERIQALKTFVRRVTKMLTVMDTTGIAIRFMNSLSDEDYNNICDVERVERIVSQMEFNGRHTRLGKALEIKILEPFVFQKTAASILTKPILVTIITDGMVTSPEKPRHWPQFLSTSTDI